MTAHRQRHLSTRAFILAQPSHQCKYETGGTEFADELSDNLFEPVGDPAPGTG
jgi:hypothetical protein